MEKPPTQSGNSDPNYELRQEIEKGLSKVEFLTVQEILPGRLLNLPTSKLSKEQLDLYRTAYQILEGMTKEGSVESGFRALKDTREDADKKAGDAGELLRVPVFRRKITGGKKEDVPISFQGNPVLGQT